MTKTRLLLGLVPIVCAWALGPASPGPVARGPAARPGTGEAVAPAEGRHPPAVAPGNACREATPAKVIRRGRRKFATVGSSCDCLDLSVGKAADEVFDDLHLLVWLKGHQAATRKCGGFQSACPQGKVCAVDGATFDPICDLDVVPEPRDDGKYDCFFVLKLTFEDYRCECDEFVPPPPPPGDTDRLAAAGGRLPMLLSDSARRARLRALRAVR